MDEYPGRVGLRFRSYLLRPTARPGGRDLERFRHYTESWRRPAAEEDAGRFRVWEGDAGPPSHSVPPHVVARAAARLGPAEFRRMHDRLLEAYFHENRDVSDTATLRRLWKEAGLPERGFETSEDPELRHEVIADHEAARELGVTGVPTVMLAQQGLPILGALPMATLRRWVDRALAGKLS